MISQYWHFTYYDITDLAACDRNVAHLVISDNIKTETAKTNNNKNCTRKRCVQREFTFQASFPGTPLPNSDVTDYATKGTLY